MKIATANPERLCQAMQETGVSVWTLSRKTGIPLQRIGAYRHGYKPCTGSTIARLAHALGIPAQDLL